MAARRPTRSARTEPSMGPTMMPREKVMFRSENTEP